MKDRNYYFNCAYAILSIEGIEIKSDNQGLPRISMHLKDYGGNDSMYGEGQIHMLKAGFVKVIPKRK